MEYTFLRTMEMKDIIAILSLAGGFFLILKGYNGTVSMIMTAIIAYYYGHKRSN